MDILKRPIVVFCLYAFILFSWPFISFPLTDGDIVNWSKVSVAFQQGEPLLSGGNDQGHGPLMAWTGYFFLNVLGQHFYSLNIFNALMGVLGVFLVYWFGRTFWKSDSIGALSAFLFVSSIAPIYLSRTPMYDWPAAIMYFGFAIFYLKYVKDNNLSFLAMALLCVGIGSLIRFSILWGLSGIYMILIRLFLYRSWRAIFIDGTLITLVVGLFNLPWLLGQVGSHGENFIQTFIYDNTGRYVKSTRPDATFRADFYGFPLYTLIGLLPFTFCGFVSFFKRSFFTRLKQDPTSMAMLFGFLPCLLLFSFSGHTKLARYIAYVFPFIISLLSYLLVTYDLKDETYRKRCALVMKWIFGALVLLLTQQAIQFSEESMQSVSFVVEVILFLFALLFLGYQSVVKHFDVLKETPQKLLPRFGVVYFLFFTALAIEMHYAPFLIWVRDGIQKTLLGG
jgi:4-amino-4-deoxy-L-arabinose transferase-like glycosyltransferase